MNRGLAAALLLCQNKGKGPGEATDLGRAWVMWPEDWCVVADKEGHGLLQSRLCLSDSSRCPSSGAVSVASGLFALRHPILMAWLM